MKKLISLRREWLLLIIIVVISLAVGVRAPVFLTWRNALDIANDSAILAILVMGQMMVLLTRGIDLSVASNLALTGMACALVGRAFPGMPIGLLILLALVVGALLGSLNGWLITGFDLPPIVVTLGTLSAYRGAIFVASRGAWISDQDIHAGIKGLPREVWLGLPALVWFALLVLGLSALFLQLRRAGREIYAVGGNPHAATYVGIPVLARLRQRLRRLGMRGGGEAQAGDCDNKTFHDWGPSSACTVAPEASMSAMAAAPNPASRRISTLCSPSRGARRRTEGWVSDQRLGIAISRIGPSEGCSTVWKNPVAARCGSATSDSSVCSGVTGISAARKAATHSAVVRVSMASDSRAYSAWALSLRVPMFFSRGSVSNRSA